MSLRVLGIIAAMSFATYPFRLLPALFVRRLSIGPEAEAAMRLVPFCIMVSMIALDVAGSGFVDYRKVAALVAVLVVGWTFDSVGLSVVAGVAAFSLLDADLLT